MRDYYAILGLPKTATSAEIDAAFRGLARKYHPDVQPEGPDATVQFKLATEAHDVLSNAEKRREYDHVHHSGRRVPISEGTSVTSPLNKPSKGPPSGPLDVEAELRLVPEEARRGGSIELRVSVPAVCPACDGQIGAGCLACGGEGAITQSRLVRVQLPPGLRDGVVLCVPGIGRTAAPDGPGGDLYLIVRVRPCW